MASRKEQKERLRKERIAAEQSEAREAARARNLRIGAGAGAILIIAVVVIVIAATGGGGGSGGGGPSPKGLPAGAEEGAQTTKAPWQPEYSHLVARAQAMKLPPPSDQIFHIHALLHVFVDGKPVPVPSQIGIDQADQYLAPLHTHDSSGIVHMESAVQTQFTLGEFFAVWGVRFTDSQLGAYKNGGGKTLQVYVDGKRIKDPVNYVMKRHDSIVVGYGKPGSFPTKLPPKFPPGL
jgi:hypothetical protein